MEGMSAGQPIGDPLKETKGRFKPISPNQQLWERVAELERRIKDLEERAKQQWPFPWPLPEVPNVPQVPDPIIDPLGWGSQRCHVCQIPFESMNHYVCMHSQCPSRVSYASTH